MSFEVGHEYSRKSISEILARPTIASGREGLAYLPGEILLFVTLDKKGGSKDKPLYNDFFEEDIFHWDSQKRQHLNTPTIQQVMTGLIDVRLFARVEEKTRGTTNPFVYCGSLEYLDHDKNTKNPVHIYFAALDFQENPNPALKALYAWRPGQGALSTATAASKSAQQGAREKRVSRNQGYLQNQERKRTTELYAMSIAVSYYQTLGFTVTDISTNESVDLKCTRGSEVRWVEVKGTSTLGEEVLLTANEVRRANSGQFITDLFIVHSIQFQGRTNEIGKDSGTIRILSDWNPKKGDLTATQYRYRVPSDGTLLA
jgi:hypothetical protein